MRRRVVTVEVCMQADDGWGALFGVHWPCQDRLFLPEGFRVSLVCLYSSSLV